MKRSILTMTIGAIGIFGTGAMVIDRALDRAVDEEPAWVALSIENTSVAAIQILAIAQGGERREPEGGANWLVAPQDVARDRPATTWNGGRHRLGGPTSVLHLTFQRSGAPKPETFAFDVAARIGGSCSVVITIGPADVVASACRDWTPTYRGTPH